MGKCVVVLLRKPRVASAWHAARGIAICAGRHGQPIAQPGDPPTTSGMDHVSARTSGSSSS